MQYAAWLRRLDQAQVGPVVLLHGPEAFLIDEGLARLAAVVCPDPALLAMSREVLDTRDAGPEGIVRAAETLPWGAPRRLIVARGVEALGPKQAEPLIDYLAKPNPSTVLALPVAQPLAPSHWLCKAVPGDQIVEVPELTGRALAGWLRSRAAADGLELADDAAQLLITLVGEDPAALAGEVLKAAIGGGADNRRVGVAEVRAVVGEHRSREVFELTRAIEQKDATVALPLLERLLAGGEEPLRILAILSGQVRRQAPAGAPVRLARCWQAERRLKLGGPPRPELVLLVADLCRA
ncbi:MAG TPA: DNA polymerase III subunit delta [Candidatus Bathyarchaeia archaeon]|nr:DNA polymerase III subunit delta [Candidatus Bathyarchaeia archaeon]